MVAEGLLPVQLTPCLWDCGLRWQSEIRALNERSLVVAGSQV